MPTVITCNATLPVCSKCSTGIHIIATSNDLVIVDKNYPCNVNCCSCPCCSFPLVLCSYISNCDCSQLDSHSFVWDGSGWVVDIDECSSSSSSSSRSSSSSASSGTIATNCCPSRLLPTTLHVTASGSCSSSSTLTYNGSRWVGTLTLTDGTMNLSFYCLGSSWSLDIGGCYIAGNTTMTGTCSPFSVSTLAFTYSGCCNAGTIIITVTT